MMTKILTETGIARERVYKEMKDRQEKVYADTDSIDVNSSYPSNKEVWEKVHDKIGYSLTIHGPFFDIELEDLSQDEFWEIITAYCREMEEGNGEDW